VRRRLLQFAKDLKMQDDKATVASAPDESAIRDAVARIDISKPFANSERMRRFLDYTVRKTLSGDRDALKEYSIGLEVFDRPDEYDPRVDSIVRVEARRLRSKLKTFYSAEGRTDPVRIIFAEGSYVPTFAWTSPHPAPAPSGEVQVALVTPSGDTRASIAVLPFAMLGCDPDSEYFCDGLTDELIHALSRLDRLRVVARTSVFQFKGAALDVREIGRRLGVESVLEGSVRGEGRRLRITTQLIGVADGFELWGERYDCDSSAALAVQEEIAQTIATILNARLATEPKSRLSSVPALPKDAYQFYLEGLYFSYRLTPPNQRHAIESFGRALSIEPRFAAAHAGLAGCYCQLAIFGADPPRRTYPLAHAAVGQAIGLDPDLPDGHLWLGFLKAVHDWDWRQAEDFFSKAIELSPSFADARYWFGGVVLNPLGRFREAKLQFHKALELDPASLVTNGGLAGTYYLENDLDAAAEQFRRTIELDPRQYGARRMLGLVLLQQGEFEKAISTLEEALPLAGGDPRVRATLGLTLGFAGREAEAVAVAEGLEAEARVGYVSPYDRAAVQIGLGNQDGACALLEDAAAERTPWLAMLKVDPMFNELRTEPRFQALVDHIFPAGAEQGGS
jgi:TolB-like protein/Flp pilus assembly protein TadD